LRKHLLAGLCLALLSGRAQAEIPVIDASSILVQAKQLAQEAKSYIVTAQQYATQIQQYAAEVEQLNGFIHDPSLGAAMGLMNTAGLGNSLPVNPMAVASLTNGYSSLTSLAGILGKLSQLDGLVNTNFATNHIYSPTDNSLSSQQLLSNANAIAGNQGAAQSAYEDLRNHLPIIQALRDRLATATNPKDVADATAQLQAEQVWTSNLQTELAAINVNYRAQADSQIQRENERTARDADSFLQAAKDQGMGLGQ
jgi:type IV secretion system protein VirB5